MNVAEAAAQLAAWAREGKGNLPLVIPSEHGPDSSTALELATAIVPATGRPVLAEEGMWADEYEAGAPLTAIAVV